MEGLGTEDGSGVRSHVPGSWVDEPPGAVDHEEFVFVGCAEQVGPRVVEERGLVGRKGGGEVTTPRIDRIVPGVSIRISGGSRCRECVDGEDGR